MFTFQISINLIYTILLEVDADRDEEEGGKH